MGRSSTNHLHLSRRVQHASTGIVLIMISYVIPPYPVGCILLLLATVAFYHIHTKRVHDETWDEWFLENFGDLLRNHEKGEWEEMPQGENEEPTDNARKLHAQLLQKNHQSKRRRKTAPALPGAFYFLLGAFLSTLLFPADVARTSVLVLSISDPMAGLVGSWLSRNRCNITWQQLLHRFLRRKDNESNIATTVGGESSIAGSIACAVSTIICTYAYIPSANPTDGGSVLLFLSFYTRLCIGILTALAEAIGGRKTIDDNLLIPLVVGLLICWYR